MIKWESPFPYYPSVMEGRDGAQTLKLCAETCTHDVQSTGMKKKIEEVGGLAFPQLVSLFKGRRCAQTCPNDAKTIDMKRIVRILASMFGNFIFSTIEKID